MWNVILWMLVCSLVGGLAWCIYHINTIYDRLEKVERDADEYIDWRNSYGKIPKDDDPKKKEGWGHEFQDK